MVEKKKRSAINNILCFFIVLCPILDIVSFLFRNEFDKTYSPSTFLRPIIPILIGIICFIKSKRSWSFIAVGLVYLIYSAIHLVVFESNIFVYSYAFEMHRSTLESIMHELQYLINYAFMALNLFLYIYYFKGKDKNIEKLKTSVVISIAIYIVSIFISIFTKTSSSTYIEGLGYKGWFESGNSISAILVLSMFILLPMLKSKKLRKIILLVILLIGVFLTFLIGTRVGLLGFGLSIFTFIISEIIVGIANKKINAKALLIGIGAVLLIIIGVTTIGSGTIERMAFLERIEDNILDESTGENSHITGTLLEIKQKIETGQITNKEMPAKAQESILNLYDYANKNNVVNNDQRQQQLIYQTYFFKNQDNTMTRVFGNGYLTSPRELVFEMEFLAILYNFGILGFILYLAPLLLIFTYALIKGLRNIKKIDTEYLMLIAGSFMSFALSILSGYIFFNSSSQIFVVIINTLLLHKAIKIGKEDNNVEEKSKANTNEIDDKKMLEEQNQTEGKKKRIVFGITSLTLGGAEKVLVDTCNELINDYDITILTIYPNGEYEKQLKKEIKVISIYNTPYNKLSKYKKKVIPFEFYINRYDLYKKHINNKYDLEVAYLEGPITSLFAVKSNRSGKKIAWIHNDINLILDSSIKSKFKKLRNLKNYKNYSKLVFVSKDNLEAFNKAYKRVKTEKEVVPNYINAEKVIEFSKDEKVLKQAEKAFSKSVVNILTVSRLTKQKGIDRLIKVHTKLIKEKVRHNIYIIGDGPEKGSLKELIKKNKVTKTFKLLGKKENPYPYIKECDYFALLSNYEGYGMVIEEAKILGKYILITDTAAREAVKGYSNSKVFKNNEKDIYTGLKRIVLSGTKLEKNSNVSYNSKDNILDKIKKVFI